MEGWHQQPVEFAVSTGCSEACNLPLIAVRSL